ncbi:DNA polymerase III subunit chi [Oceaniglobus indicus]|uniref:DNA polymerase III subunit chi n=1 Tax=Oceaniglobus indicus TaxID=2047749 RepID=UPI000C19DA57|nr:DNA polymerase III subunit chi [Oceaniglobus indicus]
MGAAFFYHLTRRPLEATLPTLLIRALGNDWRVVVRGANARRMDWLDEKLWLLESEPFLPHGLAGGEFDADQPILLTTDSAIPNGAVCLMSMDGADVTPDEVQRMERVCVLFDGGDGAALEKARSQWRALTRAGCSAQYWSEESGRWEKKTEA